MKKRKDQDHKFDVKKGSAPMRKSLENDEFDGPEDGGELDEIEWISPARDFQTMAVRRQLEARLEELALRRDLEDFPDYHLLS